MNLKSVDYWLLKLCGYPFIKLFYNRHGGACLLQRGCGCRSVGVESMLTLSTHLRVSIV